MINKLILLVVLLALAACSDSRQKREFIQGCTSTGGSKSVCSCIYSGIEGNFTQAELDAMDRNQVIPKKFNEVVLQATTTCLSDTNSGQKNVSKSSPVIDNHTTLGDLEAQVQNAPPASENPKLQKLSPAAEKAISEGMVVIKDPAVQACTDQRIEAIKKERGDPESVISFDVYNEAAVACGFNI